MAYALLIDDDPGVIKSATEMVRSDGLVLETASTWEEGLEKFYAYSPDLVICDYNLPGSDMGLSLLLRISSLRPSVRLILLSAYLNEEDAAAIRMLRLVADVIRKTNPIQAARQILREVEEASLRFQEETNWELFAGALVRVNDLDSSAFDELNAFLQANRLPRGENT